MKWDDSMLDANGGRRRYAYFQDDTTAHTLTDYNGRRITLWESGADNPLLSEATPTVKGRRWLVRIDRRAGKPLRKYEFHFADTKDQAIDIMLKESS